MDAATAAAMSDPERNGLFRRRWAESFHKPPVRGQVMDDIELAGRALLEEWRCSRSRERMAAAASGGERAWPPCPSGRRSDGIVTT